MNMENINIDEIINKWFDMKLKTYDRLEHDESIYLYYDGEKVAEFRIDKESKYIYYTWKLYDEISQIIDLNYRHFEMLMTKWVEETFGFKRFTPSPDGYPGTKALKIPK